MSPTSTASESPKTPSVGWKRKINYDRQDFPHGKFKLDLDDRWSKDKTTKYFQGYHNKVVWPTVKSLIFLFSIFILKINGFSWLTTLLIVMAGVGTYQHAVCLLFGLSYMPAMDQATFISSSKTHVNFLSITGIEGKFSKELLMRKAEDCCRQFPKFR